MADRAVRKTGKDAGGDITSLCSPGEAWSPVSKQAAIDDIRASRHRYYVPWASGSTWIHVVDGVNGPYLRTDRDNSPRNNLDELPDC